jgi:hypothetical protein
MFYYFTEDIKTEAQNKSVLRVRGIMGPDHLMLTDRDQYIDYLKRAADEVQVKIQTLSDGYEFDQGKISWKLNEKADERQALYTLIKNYLVEGILKGWFEDNMSELALISDRKQEQYIYELQNIRIKKATKKYHGI